jgi:membrane protein YqaA with SNARE-associated domain
MTVLSSLWTMFTVSFLAATVLPVGSEPLFIALVRLHPGEVPALLAVATLGNTLGGLTSYALGRFVAGRVAPEAAASRWGQWLRRFGAPTLLLAWAPVGGDLLCLLAGWMRISWWQAALWMALGKLARYWVLAVGAALW